MSQNFKSAYQQDGETRVDNDGDYDLEPHLHKNNVNDSVCRSLCQEKMPLLSMDEKTSHFQDFELQSSADHQLPLVHRKSHLSKTFTEPTNLSYFSYCSESPDEEVVNDPKKSRIDSKTTLIVDEEKDNHRKDEQVAADSESYSKDEQLAKNLKSISSWRMLERGTKVGALCSHCPKCSSSTHAALLTSVNVCSCRLCRLLHDGLIPKYSLPHGNFDRKEYGAMCQVCGQAGSLTTNLDPNRCPLKTSLSSPQVAHLSSKPPRKESTEESVQESFRPGVIVSREQGVQVSKWSLSSTSSSNVPLCRICHSPGDKMESLMSPCRCSGSLQFVHSSCLLRWLDISRRKSHRSPHCELCGYKYQRHKTIRIRKFQCPPCCRRDKFLHVTFILAVLIMFACATLTVISFESQRNHKYVRKGPNEKVELNSQEVITLVCGIMFFCAFFLAMYVQVKAQATIYRWMTRFWMMNQEWEIEDYRPERDPEYFRANKHRLISRYNNNNNNNNGKNEENIVNNGGGSRRSSTKPSTSRPENSSDAAVTASDDTPDDRIPRFSTV